MIGKLFAQARAFEYNIYYNEIVFVELIQEVKRDEFTSQELDSFCIRFERYSYPSQKAALVWSFALTILSRKDFEHTCDGKPHIPEKDDTMAEWLRRWMQVPLGFARAGSNPARVAIIFFCFTLVLTQCVQASKLIYNHIRKSSLAISLLPD